MGVYGRLRHKMSQFITKQCGLCSAACAGSRAAAPFRRQPDSGPASGLSVRSRAFPPARRGAGAPVPGAGARALLQAARVEQRCGQALGPLQARAQSVQGRQATRRPAMCAWLGWLFPLKAMNCTVQAGTLDGATGHQTLAVGEQHDLEHRTRVMAPTSPLRKRASATNSMAK